MKRFPGGSSASHLRVCVFFAISWRCPPCARWRFYISTNSLITELVKKTCSGLNAKPCLKVHGYSAERRGAGVAHGAEAPAEAAAMEAEAQQGPTATRYQEHPAWWECALDEYLAEPEEERPLSAAEVVPEAPPSPGATYNVLRGLTGLISTVIIGVVNTLSPKP